MITHSLKAKVLLKGKGDMGEMKHPKKPKQPINLLKPAIIVACVGVAVAVCYVIWFIYSIFSSQYYENPMPYYDYAKIHAYPDKLVYVAGEDTALGLEGAAICFGYGSRKAKQAPCVGDECTSQWVVNSIEDADPRFLEVEVIADVDFNQPGKYPVMLRSRIIEGSDDYTLECSFEVEVVEPDIAE